MSAVFPCSLHVRSQSLAQGSRNQMTWWCVHNVFAELIIRRLKSWLSFSWKLLPVSTVQLSDLLWPDLLQLIWSSLMVFNCEISILSTLVGVTKHQVLIIIQLWVELRVNSRYWFFNLLSSCVRIKVSIYHKWNTYREKKYLWYIDTQIVRQRHVFGITPFYFRSDLWFPSMVYIAPF